jgi:hypothetical protein
VLRLVTLQALRLILAGSVLGVGSAFLQQMAFEHAGRRHRRRPPSLFRSMGRDDDNGIDQTTGLYNQPTSASAVHWPWNNQALAKLLGNPFPGVGRNTLRGQDYNNLDASVFKTVPITERVHLQLQLNAYNVLNHQFYGTPDVTVEDFTPGSPNSSFLNLALVNGGNIRTLQLVGKITF